MESNTIKIKKINQVYMQVLANDGIMQEIKELFTAYAKNYQWSPRYYKKIFNPKTHKFKKKRTSWDGKISLFKFTDQLLYIGLLYQLVDYAKKHNYKLEIEGSEGFNENSLSVVEAENFINDIIQLDRAKFTERDYQLKSLIQAIRKKRMLLISPTSSGKSLIMYLIVRYLLHSEYSKKILIIVPSINLVEQLQKDFVDYGWTANNVHKIYQGKEKNPLVSPPVFISTWQSLYPIKDQKFFEQFDAVIGDEAHEQDTKETKGILERLVNAEYRIGMTGTLDKHKITHLTLEGLFGRLTQFVTTKELIDRGDLAKFRIKVILLKHPQTSCAFIANDKGYQEEVDFINASESRNKFIVNLSMSLKGNTLILFRYIDKHGKILLEMLKSEADKYKKKIFFVYGKTEVEVREQTREILEKHDNVILLASVGTFSRGVNIKNLHNIIFGMPNKSKIKTLQSIGRILRLHDSKEFATLFDIADDLRIDENCDNTTLKHLGERLNIYDEEKFEYKIYKVNLKGKE